MRVRDRDNEWESRERARERKSESERESHQVKRVENMSEVSVAEGGGERVRERVRMSE